jgi:hypothetical protein
MREINGVAKAIVPPEPPGTSGGRRGYERHADVWERPSKRHRNLMIVVILAILALAVYLIL